MKKLMLCHYYHIILLILQKILIMKKSFNLISVMAITLGLLSCSDDNQSDNSYDRIDVELTRNETVIAGNQYQLPVDLLISAYNTDYNQNAIISPLSTTMVLAMLTNAAEPSDREEMLEVLNLTATELDDYNDFAAKLITILPSLDPFSILNINNGFWYSKSAKLSESYKDILNVSYSASINNFDTFNREVLENINSWVNTKTSGGIPEILNESDLNLKLECLWLNALYFKGVWRQKFEDTEKMPFYSSYPDKSNPAMVDMMKGHRFRYAFAFNPEGKNDSSNEIITAMLPYGNESFIFTAVLPPANNPDIITTLKALTPDYWEQADKISAETKEKGHYTVYLPKMSIKKTTNLIPVLKDLGVNKMFNSFSMATNLGLSDQIIGIFRQNVVFDVDEEGSEIKVATVAGDMYGAVLDQGMCFNRPFIYFVRERSTGTVLLAGVYSKP